MTPVRVTVLVVMLLAMLADLAYPPVIHRTTRPLTKSEKQLYTERRPGGMPAAPVPKAVVTNTLVRMPVWHKAKADQINWRGWTSPEERIKSGTSIGSFLNGLIFQLALIGLVGLGIVAVLNRIHLQQRQTATEEPVPPAETPEANGSPH